MEPDCDLYCSTSTTNCRQTNSRVSQLRSCCYGDIQKRRNNMNAAQWKQVPGTQNPADNGSRRRAEAQLQFSHRWFTGPAFLLDPSDQWPSQTAWRHKDDTSSEVETVGAVYTTSLAESTQEIAIGSAIEQANTLARSKP